MIGFIISTEGCQLDVKYLPVSTPIVRYGDSMVPFTCRSRVIDDDLHFSLHSCCCYYGNQMLEKGRLQENMTWQQRGDSPRIVREGVGWQLGNRKYTNVSVSTLCFLLFSFL